MYRQLEIKLTHLGMHRNSNNYAISHNGFKCWCPCHEIVFAILQNVFVVACGCYRVIKLKLLIVISFPICKLPLHWYSSLFSVPLCRYFCIFDFRITYGITELIIWWMNNPLSLCKIVEQMPINGRGWHLLNQMGEPLYIHFIRLLT